MTQAALEPRQRDVRRRWVSLLARLASDIESWSQSGGWEVDRKDVGLFEDGIGAYEAPLLRVHKGRRTLTVEPVARFVSKAGGLVYIRGRLPFKRLMLARERNAWKVYTEERIPWPEVWSQSAFLKIAEALTGP